jgi:hypothetical protein
MTETSKSDPRKGHKGDRVSPAGESVKAQIGKQDHQTTSSGTDMLPGRGGKIVGILKRAVMNLKFYCR